MRKERVVKKTTRVTMTHRGNKTFYHTVKITVTERGKDEHLPRAKM
jgi:hypothetical protein